MDNVSKYISVNSSESTKPTQPGGSGVLKLTVSLLKGMQREDLKYRLFVRLSKGLAHSTAPTNDKVLEAGLHKLSDQWDGGVNFPSTYTPAWAETAPESDHAFLIEWQPADAGIDLEHDYALLYFEIFFNAQSAGYDFVSDPDQSILIGLLATLEDVELSPPILIPIKYPITPTYVKPTLSDLKPKDITSGKGSKYWVGSKTSQVTLQGKVAANSKIQAQWRLDSGSWSQSLALESDGSGLISIEVRDNLLTQAGEHKIEVQVARNDLAGGWSSPPASVSIWVDLKPPQFKNPKIALSGADLKLSGTLTDDDTDAQSGVKSWSYSYDNTKWQPAPGAAVDLKIDQDLDKGFWVRATNNLDNTSQPERVKLDPTGLFKLDVKNPFPAEFKENEQHDFEANLELTQPGISVKLPPMTVGFLAPGMSISSAAINSDSTTYHPASLAVADMLPIFKDVIFKQRANFMLKYVINAVGYDGISIIPAALHIFGDSIASILVDLWTDNKKIYFSLPNIFHQNTLSTTNSAAVQIDGYFAGSVQYSRGLEFKFYVYKPKDDTEWNDSDLVSKVTLAWVDYLNPEIDQELNEFKLHLPATAFETDTNYLVLYRVGYKGAKYFQQQNFKIKVNNSLPGLADLSVKRDRGQQFKIAAQVTAALPENAADEKYEVSWDGSEFVNVSENSNVELNASTNPAVAAFSYFEDLAGQSLFFSPELRVTSKAGKSITREIWLNTPAGLFDVTMKINKRGETTELDHSVKLTKGGEYDLQVIVNTHIGVEGLRVDLAPVVAGEDNYLSRDSNAKVAFHVNPPLTGAAAKVAVADDWVAGNATLGSIEYVKEQTTITFIAPVVAEEIGKNTITVLVSELKPDPVAFLNPAKFTLKVDIV